MTKWYGEIGYVETERTAPGVYTGEIIVKRNYYGDIHRKSSRWNPSGEKINDDLRVNVEISVIADPYALQHCSKIRFVKYMDTYWRATSITPKYPRIIIELGEEYNGSTDSTSQ